MDKNREGTTEKDNFGNVDKQSFKHKGWTRLSYERSARREVSSDAFNNDKRLENMSVEELLGEMGMNDADKKAVLGTIGGNDTKKAVVRDTTGENDIEMSMVRGKRKSDEMNHSHNNDDKVKRVKFEKNNKFLYIQAELFIIKKCIEKKQNITIDDNKKIKGENKENIQKEQHEEVFSKFVDLEVDGQRMDVDTLPVEKQRMDVDTLPVEKQRMDVNNLYERAESLNGKIYDTKDEKTIDELIQNYEEVRSKIEQILGIDHDALATEASRMMKELDNIRNND